MAIGLGTAGAVTLPAEQTQAPVTQQVVIANSAAHTVTATLASGHFVANTDSHAIDVTNAAGTTVESIPLTVHGAAVPVAAAVSSDGRALTLRQVGFNDTATLLLNQWMWGMAHGGAVGTFIGCFIGAFFLFVLPGCALGAAIGWTVTNPNSGQVGGTLFNLITDH